MYIYPYAAVVREYWNDVSTAFKYFNSVNVFSGQKCMVS